MWCDSSRIGSLQSRRPEAAVVAVHVLPAETGVAAGFVHWHSAGSDCGSCSGEVGVDGVRPFWISVLLLNVLLWDLGVVWMSGCQPFCVCSF